MIAIHPVKNSDEPFARQLAAQWHLPLGGEAPVILMVSEQGCWLRRIDTPVLDWSIDFLSADYQQRFAQRTRHNDSLARAIGLHKKADMRVLDMTAGLGKDALWLAHCGAHVTLIERHPVLAFLLEQAIEKFKTVHETGDRMEVICCDVRTYLSSLEKNQFDVAYYDPMFTPRNKSALVKKDMQILQALHGEENPEPDLIASALSVISKVVVKRGKNDDILYGKPHHQLTTKVTRFDIYTRE